MIRQSKILNTKLNSFIYFICFYLVKEWDFSYAFSIQNILLTLPLWSKKLRQYRKDIALIMEEILRTAPFKAFFRVASSEYHCAIVWLMKKKNFSLYHLNWLFLKRKCTGLFLKIISFSMKTVGKSIMICHKCIPIILS